MSDENQQSGNDVANASGNDNNPFRVAIDPASIKPASGSAPLDPGSSASVTPSQKRRGRPPGSKNANRVATPSVALPVDAISSVLFSLHAMVSAAIKVPELALDEKEAKQIAEAGAKVATHYNVIASPKTVDWVNFCMVLGMVYGTRLIAVRARLRTEATKKPPARKPSSEVVTPFPGAGIMPPFDNGGNPPLN